MPQSLLWLIRSRCLLMVVGCVLLAACGAKIKAPPEPPAPIRRGDEAFRHRQYEDAISLYGSYTDVVDKDQYTARALYKKALSQYQIGRFSDVLVTLQDVQTRYPDGHWVQVDALRGDAQRALGHPVAAIESWDAGWSAAGEMDRPKLRLRVATVARDLTTAELAEARRLVKSDEVGEMLATQIAKREHPDLTEPMPEFDGSAEVETADSEAGRAVAQDREQVPAGEPEIAEPETAAAEPESLLAGSEIDDQARPENEVAAAPVAVPDEGPSIDEDDAKIAVLLVGGDTERNGRLLHAAQLALGESRLIVREANHDAAAQAMTEIAANPTVLAVLGPIDGEAVRLTGDVASRVHLPMLEVSSADIPVRPYVLHAGVARGALVSPLLDYAMNRARLRRFGVAYPDNAAGQAFLASFKSSVDQRGGAIVGVDAYAPDVRPVTAGMVHRWREKDNLQGLVLYDGAAAANTYAKFLQRELPDITLLGLNDWEALAAENDSLSGVVFASVFSADNPRVATRDFVNQYQQAFQQTPTTLDAVAYEAALLVKHGLAEGAKTRSGMWREVTADASVEGPTGKLRVVNSRIERQPVLVQVFNGKLQAVQSNAALPGADIAATTP